MLSIVIGLAITQVLQDLRAHYHAHRGWFFGVLVATLLASLAKDLVLEGRLPPTANLAFYLVVTALCTIAAVARACVRCRPTACSSAG